MSMEINVKKNDRNDSMTITIKSDEVYKNFTMILSQSEALALSEKIKNEFLRGLGYSD